MDTRLTELLVCPLCKGPLQRDSQGTSLICRADRLAFPVRDGIPIMLEAEAIQIEDTEDAVPAAALLTGQPAPSTTSGTNQA